MGEQVSLLRGTDVGMPLLMLTGGNDVEERHTELIESSRVDSVFNDQY